MRDTWPCNSATFSSACFSLSSAAATSELDCSSREKTLFPQQTPRYQSHPSHRECSMSLCETKSRYSG